MAPEARSLGFMAGIGGNPAARRLTLSSFSDNLLPAAVSCGFNAAGGAAARGIGHRIDGWKAGYGTIGVALIAIGLKAAVQPVDDVHVAVRELAAGMAGYVGDEVMDSVILWWKSETWKAGKVYPKGTFVRYTGGYWQAAEDVPAGGSEPGKDSRWLKVSAISYQLSDIKECARLVLMDKKRVEMISAFVASELGKQRGWDQQTVAGSAADVQTALGKVAEEINKL